MTGKCGSFDTLDSTSYSDLINTKMWLQNLSSAQKILFTTITSTNLWHSPHKLKSFFSTLSLWNFFFQPNIVGKIIYFFSTQTMVLHLLHVQQRVVNIINEQPIGRASTTCMTYVLKYLSFFVSTISALCQAKTQFHSHKNNNNSSSQHFT